MARLPSYGVCRFIVNVFTLDINTDACVVFAAKLEKLNKSALPMAVRGTLNAAAFNVKQVTLDKSASKHFIRRAPTFFKAFTAVNKANGYNINSMQSEVGMYDRGQPTAHTAIKHMETQEHGGNINTGADYLKGSRAGSLSRKVTRSNYFDKSNLIDPAKSSQRFSGPRSKKSMLVAEAVMAKKLNKPISLLTSKGRFLVKVTGVTMRKGKRKGSVKITSKLIMMQRKHAPIKATHFSREAALATVKNMDDMFYQEAKKQFDRVLY